VKAERMCSIPIRGWLKDGYSRLKFDILFTVTLHNVKFAILFMTTEGKKCK